MAHPSTPAPAHDSAGRENIWIQRVLTLWIILMIAAGVKAIIQPSSHTVYPVFAAGARHWYADMPLYVDYEGLDLFRYTPTFAVAVTPFAIFPDIIGGVLWNMASVAVLFWSFRVLVRDVFPDSWPPWREAAFLGLALVGTARGVWAGQNNAFLFAAAAFGIAAVANKRWWAAALLLALPVFIKVWPIALVLLLMACWPRQLIGRFVVAVAALAAVPFLTRPPAVVLEVYHQWWKMLVSTGPTRWPGYRDAWTIWEQIDQPVSQVGYLALQLGTASLVLGWCLWQRRRTASARQLLTSIMSIWLAWQLLFGPGTERLTYLIIAPMAAWAVVTSFAERKGRVLSLTAWLMTGILGTGGAERALLPYFSAAPSILPAGVVVFIVWLVIYARNRPAEAVSSPNESPPREPASADDDSLCQEAALR